MRPVILFDGECSFCDSSVQFILKRDPNRYFNFAALQSETGKQLTSAYNIPDNEKSLLFIDKGVCYDKSSAALHIAKHLNGVWKISFLFVAVPKPVRDLAYNQFAKRRYKWFGKKNSCTLPSVEERRRFL